MLDQNEVVKDNVDAAIAAFVKDQLDHLLLGLTEQRLVDGYRNLVSFLEMRA